MKNIEPQILEITPSKRFSLWLMTAAMILIIGLKSHGEAFPQVPWHFLGWPLLFLSVALAWRKGAGSWAKTTVLLA